MIQARGNVALKNNEKFTEKAEGAIEQARLAARTAQAAGMEAHHFEEKTELARYLSATAHRGDVIWCKASHGMALEEVIAAFYREYHA